MRSLILTLLGGCVLASGIHQNGSGRLAKHVHQLLQILEKTDGQNELVNSLRNILRQENAADFPERLHAVLAPRCLMRVTINPESRVKATRGDAPARLRLDTETVFLIRVQNEAGVTHPLKMSLSEGTGRWLRAQLRPVSVKGLSGTAEEYVILRLSGRDSGKREATLTFDVGQGTQDLGFRAEVPVLFTIR